MRSFRAAHGVVSKARPWWWPCLRRFSPAAASLPTASAEVDDGTLTVIVNRDLDRDNAYDAGEDPPQPGIDITVRDAQGKTKHGRTGSDGRYVLEGTDDLVGGLYFVVAEIPSVLSDLAPVPESETFAPLSTTVDVSADSQTVRMGVAVKPGPTEPAAGRAEQRAGEGAVRAGEVRCGGSGLARCRPLGSAPGARNQRSPGSVCSC